MIKIIRTNSDNTNFRDLVSLLDEDLKIRDGEEHAFYAQFNTIDTIKHVIVAYIENTPAGCGAIKPYTAAIVEIKRIFVQPAFRGQGIAWEIVSELEAWAKELNFSTCILETGKNQPEAISLYYKAGYHLIPSYGQYKNVENSVCMKKEISTES